MPALVINRLARTLAKIVDQRFKGLGITASQLPVLVALSSGEGLNQKHLAQLIGVEQASMAQLLSRMEREGLIVRHQSSIDGRSSVITMTKLAQEKLDPGRSLLRHLDQEITSVLTSSESKKLLHQLYKLERRGEELLKQAVELS